MVQLDGVMEMTDKELIKLAAKAAGISKQWDGSLVDKENPNMVWNPLTDDGDALRLAVKLRLMVNVCPYIVIATDGNIHAEEETGKQSDAKATRRAITRAAAQIGKEME